MPCSQLWAAVKDVLKTDKYGILSINNDEMTASYNVCGLLNCVGTTDSVALVSQGEGCDMLVHAEYKKTANGLMDRVTKSLAKPTLPAK